MMPIHSKPYILDIFIPCTGLVDCDVEALGLQLNLDVLALSVATRLYDFLSWINVCQLKSCLI